MKRPRPPRVLFVTDVNDSTTVELARLVASLRQATGVSAGLWALRATPGSERPDGLRVVDDLRTAPLHVAVERRVGATVARRSRGLAVRQWYHRLGPHVVVIDEHGEAASVIPREAHPAVVWRRCATPPTLRSGGVGPEPAGLIGSPGAARLPPHNGAPTRDDPGLADQDRRTGARRALQLDDFQYVIGWCAPRVPASAHDALINALRRHRSLDPGSVALVTPRHGRSGPSTRPQVSSPDLRPRPAHELARRVEPRTLRPALDALVVPLGAIVGDDFAEAAHLDGTPIVAIDPAEGLDALAARVWNEIAAARRPGSATPNAAADARVAGLAQFLATVRDGHAG